MVSLSADDMVRKYLVSALTAEFQYAQPKHEVTFNCQDANVFALIVSWLNCEQKGVTLFTSQQFRFVVIIGPCPRTFFLKLLRPQKIQAVMMQ